MKALYQERVMHELCEITSSKRIFAADYQTEGIPFFRGKEITERFNGAIGVSTELFIARQKFEEIKAKFGVPNVGDLLLTSVGTLGSTYVVQPGDEFYFKDGNITWFKNFKGLNSTYLHYWLSSPAGKAEQKKCTIGSSQSAYTIVLLKEMKIALPPLEEQRRIASILSAYDDLIENNTRRIAILEEMARRIYEEWFVRFRFPGHEQVKMVESELGAIPEGWEVGCLKNVVRLLSGFAFKTQDFVEDGAYGLVTIKNVQDGEFVTECTSRLDAIPKKMASHCELKTGDCLLSLTGNVGRCCTVIGHNYLLNQRVAKLNPVRTGDKAYVYFLFRSETTRKSLEAISNGVAQQNLSPIQTENLPWIIPSVGIRSEFDAVVAPMLDLATTLRLKNSNLRATRDLLLPKLISGELDVSTLPEPEETLAA